ncbi:hypothetical protein PsorP6_014608 [Peronosclerospora sorghi]|uniref:Uncharacterized protein n=1 Tax=Peronosclerospora sorghi TaxID=230839 RepID=A0ACC0VVZ8_9STRA|nr:hypothetical protein PsorP6_014608 [Peronosclerospora sorghi]
MISVPQLPRKLLTLAFIVRNRSAGHDAHQVLLGFKKRGFGLGKWNGFGGKVEPTDVSIAAAAVREVKEEVNVHIKLEDLQPRGVLLFSFEEGKNVLRFSGEPSESEEMRPHWYELSNIPFANMWADDRFWLPHVLSGKSVQGHFHFAADEDTLLDHKFEVFVSQ